MSDYLVHGKKGNGKSLVVVGRIRDALVAGKPVATNLNLNLEKLLPIGTRNVRCFRLPDRPTLADMLAIGIGSPVVDESTYGLIVLDEMATWMNTRGWNEDGKARQALLNFFVHSRKLGWDTYFICQAPAQIDKQVRESLVELSVSCKRLDKIRIPFIGVLTKHLLGFELRAPKVHIATVRYGMDQHAVISDRWTYRGHGLYAGYDTRQVFREDYPDGLFSYLSPWHTTGRYTKIPMRLSEWLKAWFKIAPRANPKVLPKNGVVALLSALPPDERMKHYKRFQLSGGI